MDPELVRAVNYAQKLLDAAIDVVGAAPECVELNQNWARDPKIVALTILCRSISNFRASVRLVQQEQPLEARALVRLMYENLLILRRGILEHPVIVPTRTFVSPYCRVSTMHSTTRHF